LDFVIFDGGKSLESWTLSFLMAEKAWKIGLCNFYWRKKLGNLDFAIFYGRNKYRK
jgi:hypothetical protein